jgi:hypothetical protein
MSAEGLLTVFEDLHITSFRHPGPWEFRRSDESTLLDDCSFNCNELCFSARAPGKTSIKLTEQSNAPRAEPNFRTIFAVEILKRM